MLTSCRRCYKNYRRWILFSLFVIALILVRLNGFGVHIDIDYIKANRDALQSTVEHNYCYSVLLYIAAYVAAVTLYLPIAAVLSITGGFLFGTFWGAIYANIGATVGAIIAFLLVRYFFGKAFQKKYEKALERFNRHMRKEGTLYLLTVHFIAVIPFFVINILAGLTNVSLWTFIWTTAVGIFPGTFVYTFAGQQLNKIDSVRDIFSLPVLLAFLLLALLAFIPNIIKYYRRLSKT